VSRGAKNLVREPTRIPSQKKLTSTPFDFPSFLVCTYFYSAPSTLFSPSAGPFFVTSPPPNLRVHSATAAPDSIGKHFKSLHLFRQVLRTCRASDHLFLQFQTFHLIQEKKCLNLLSKPLATRSGGRRLELKNYVV
jgi:hypothetical protein